MAKTDFQIQSESGQLWPDLMAWRDEAVAAKDKELTDTVAKYAAVFDALQNPDKTKEDAAAELAKEAKARELEALQKQLAEEQAQVAEVEAKISALSK